MQRQGRLLPLVGLWWLLFLRLGAGALWGGHVPVPIHSTFLCWEDTSSPHTVHTFINEILASVIPGGKMKCYIGLKQWYCRKGVSKMPLQICKAFFGYKTQRIPISQVPEESAGTVASVANAASG